MNINAINCSGYVNDKFTKLENKDPHHAKVTLLNLKG